MYMIRVRFKKLFKKILPLYVLSRPKRKFEDKLDHIESCITNSNMFSTLYCSVGKFICRFSYNVQGDFSLFKIYKTWGDIFSARHNLIVFDCINVETDIHYYIYISYRVKMLVLVMKCMYII